MSEIMSGPEMVDTAQMLSREAHEGQVDKSGEPYYLHPHTVANMLDEKDYVGRTVAYLHDVLEDTDIEEEDLREIFPDKVVDAVVAITKWDKYQPYQEYIENQVSTNDIAVRVKLCDLTHNMDESRIVEKDDNYEQRMEKYKTAYAFLEQVNAAI